MPKGDKCEDQQIRDDRFDRGLPAAERRATQRDVNVPDEPAVVRAMPGTPKQLRAVVVAHASNHVLWRVNAIHQGPETEHAPGKQQLQPDDVKVEEGQKTELSGSVVAPNGGRLANRSNIVVMQDKLHGKENKQEPDAVSNCARPFDTRGAILGLRDVVVEGNNGTGNVQRRVQCVRYVVAERKVLDVGRDRDSVALGKAGGIQSLLLGCIRHIRYAMTSEMGANGRLPLESLSFACRCSSSSPG